MVAYSYVQYIRFPLLILSDTRFQQFSLHDLLNHSNIANYNSHKEIRRLSQLSQATSGKKYSRTEIATQIFAALVPSAALYSQAVSTAVHYYLKEDRKEQLQEVTRLLESSDKDASSKVMTYVYEALS